MRRVPAVALAPAGLALALLAGLAPWAPGARVQGQQVPCGATGFAALAPVAGSGVQASLSTAPRESGAAVAATVANLRPGEVFGVFVPTTTGLEPVTGTTDPSNPPGAPVTVSGPLEGLPLAGAAAVVVVGLGPGGAGQVVAQGPLRCEEPAAPPPPVAAPPPGAPPPPVAQPPLPPGQAPPAAVPPLPPGGPPPPAPGPPLPPGVAPYPPGPLLPGEPWPGLFTPTPTLTPTPSATPTPTLVDVPTLGPTPTIDPRSLLAVPTVTPTPAPTEETADGGAGGEAVEPPPP
jgi:hypothetical protein